MYYKLSVPRHPILLRVMDALHENLGSHEIAIADEARLRNYLKTKTGAHCG